jgi:hypothetical protein
MLGPKEEESQCLAILPDGLQYVVESQCFFPRSRSEANECIIRLASGQSDMLS